MTHQVLNLFRRRKNKKRKKNKMKIQIKKNKMIELNIYYMYIILYYLINNTSHHKLYLTL